VWVDLKKINFGANSGVRKLQLHGNPGLGGNQTDNIQASEPFVFLAPE